MFLNICRYEFSIEPYGISNNIYNKSYLLQYGFQDRNTLSDWAKSKWEWPSNACWLELTILHGSFRCQLERVLTGIHSVRRTWQTKQHTISYCTSLDGPHKPHNTQLLHSMRCTLQTEQRTWKTKQFTVQRLCLSYFFVIHVCIRYNFYKSVNWHIYPQSLSLYRRLFWLIYLRSKPAV